MFMLRPRLNFLNGHGLLLSKRLFASQAEVDGFFNDALALAGSFINLLIFHIYLHIIFYLRILIALC